MEKMYQERMDRVKKTIALEKADRVPLMPMMSSAVTSSYDASMQDAMTDLKTIIPAMDKMLEDMNPDYIKAPDYFSKKGMDILGPININYPGKSPEFGSDYTYQVLDHAFMEDDEYEDFLKDPSAYLLHNVLAKKYEALSGLRLLDPYGLCGSTVMGFGGLAAPPVQKALQAMLDAGKAVSEFIETTIAVELHLKDKGFPVWGSAVASNPFDLFSDNIRGLINTVMDLKTDPELLEQAVDRFTDVSIASARNLCKMTHSDIVFIPLHAGVDEFMSPDDFADYYWPPLKKLINAMIQDGVTPFVGCQGNFHTRLDVLKDVPKGKVIYGFEKVDMAKAKKELEGIACIAGNLDTNLLTYGTKEAVVEATKRLLDVCAPGGGYIMSNAVGLDNVKPENLAAWSEAVEKYGRY